MCLICSLHALLWGSPLLQSHHGLCFSSRAHSAASLWTRARGALTSRILLTATLLLTEGKHGISPFMLALSSCRRNSIAFVSTSLIREMNTYTFSATPSEMIQTRRIGSGMTKWSRTVAASPPSASRCCLLFCILLQVKRNHEQKRYDPRDWNLSTLTPTIRTVQENVSC